MSLFQTITDKFRTKASRTNLDIFSTSGVRPAVEDASAWESRYAWGEALNKGHKPRSKSEFIEAFTSWVYICVKLNAQAVASTPLRLYAAKPEKGKKLIVPTKSVDHDRLKFLYSRADLERYLTKSEEVEEVTEHRFLDLIQNVNPYHNARDLKELTTMYSDLAGEAYWLLIKDSLGIPEEVWPIPSQHINPIYGKTLADAIVGYLYKRGNVEVVFKPEQIVHFAYPNPHNLFAGFSTVKGVADAVYIQSEMSATETALFENRARPGGILTSKENISKPDRDRLKEDFGQRYEGSRKAGKTMLLPRGVDYTRDAMTPTELNYIDGRRLIREEICASLDIPVARFDVKAIRANADAAKVFHAEFGILPRCDRFSQKINEKILPLYGNENTKIFCAFDDPVPENRELLLEERKGYVSSGLWTINEVRSDMGKDEIEGGDVPLVDSRLVPLGSAPPTNEQATELAERAIKAMRERLG